MTILYRGLQHFIEVSNSGRIRHDVAVNLAVNYFNLIILFSGLGLAVGVPFVFKNKLGTGIITSLFLVAAFAARHVSKAGRPELAMNRYAILLWMISATHLFASQQVGIGGLMVCSFLTIYGTIVGFGWALLYAVAYLLFACGFFAAIRFGFEAKVYFPGGTGPELVALILTLPVALLPLPHLFRQINDSLRHAESEIKERKIAELSLQHSTERFADFSGSVSDWFWETDADHRFTFLSRPSKEQGMVGEYKNIGLRPWETLSGNEENLVQLWQSYRQRLDSRQAFRDFEYPIKIRGGEARWISASGKPLFSSTGDFLGYRGVGIDITEHMQVELSMIEARNAAELANRAKTQFLSNLSHEVKTPLNGILGLTSLLEMGALSEDQSLMLRELKISTVSLQTMLNRILDFSNLESGSVKLRLEPFSLRETCEIPIDSHRVAATAKGLNLCFRFDDHLPTIVVGDPTKLLQILDNLIDNAIKFTDRGEVKLAVTVSGKKALVDQVSICFAVSDTGCGIAKELHSAIFEAFSQGDGTITRRAGGNGIGLAICRSVTKLLKGTMHFDSTPGQGSEFRVTVPFDVMAL